MNRTKAPKETRESNIRTMGKLGNDSVRLAYYPSGVAVIIGCSVVRFPDERTAVLYIRQRERGKKGT